MKILTILGSYRRSGNTASILKMTEESLETLAAEAGIPLTLDRLNIGEVTIGPCRGCRLCFDRGETTCPQKDDLLEIKARIDSADAVICGTPVYVGDVSGSLKTLIDRLAFVCHRPQFFGKTLYLIATTAGSPSNTALNVLSGAGLTWGMHLAGRQSFTMGARMPAETARAQFGGKAAAIARKVFTAVRDHHPGRPSFLNLMIFRTQQYTWSREDPKSLDYQYWKDRGWTDPKTTFYMPYKASPIWTGLARLVGGVLGRIWG